MINMIKRMKLTTALAASLFVLSGCILSVQYVLEIFRAGPFYYTTTGSFSAVSVDLTENEDFDEHKDEIDRIESIHFGGNVINNLVAANVMAMYISAFSYPNYSAMMVGFENGDVLCVLADMPVPAGGTTPPTKVLVTAKDSDPFLNHDEEDFDEISALVKTGHFYSYATGGTGDPFDLEFSDCLYHVVFTASK